MTAKTAAPAAAAPKVEVKPTPCRCGCGQPTHRPEARYIAGHDARHAGEIGRQAHANNDRELIGIVFADAPKLAAKAQRVVNTAEQRLVEKAAAAKAREAAKAAAKIAYDAALAAK